MGKYKLNNCGKCLKFDSIEERFNFIKNKICSENKFFALFVHYNEKKIDLYTEDIEESAKGDNKLFSLVEFEKRESLMASLLLLKLNFKNVIIHQ